MPWCAQPRTDKKGTPRSQTLTNSDPPEISNYGKVSFKFSAGNAISLVFALGERLALLDVVM